MRTIKLELETAHSVADKVRISTEVIVEEGAEKQAGTEAKKAIDDFLEGYGAE